MTKRDKQSAIGQLRAHLQRERSSQSALAAELGIGSAHLSDILSGRRRPSLDLAVRIEIVAGIPPKQWAA